jgi:hypothetical protein
MASFIAADTLIREPQPLRPHVVLLGAGASRAAFPAGDPSGLRLPVMADLVDILDLRAHLNANAPEFASETNFEVIYSSLREDTARAGVADELERRVRTYFSKLRLPNEATLYDRLLLALRPTDAVFTFNWDPFLFDSYQRNRDRVPLPAIYFLHGNVRIGACRAHKYWGHGLGRCPQCGALFDEVPLLFPVRVKNYSSDPYIARAWQAARDLFRHAFTMTVFGYGAPASDLDAVELLRTAWLSGSDRKLEHIHVVDTAPTGLLHERWAPFAPTLHLWTEATFAASRIARWPRRTCESLIFPMSEGLPCDDFPLPASDDLAALQAYCRGIADHEPPDDRGAGA